LVLAIATVAAAQQGGGSPAPSASPDAEAGWVWSPECGCKMRNSILAVTPLKLVFASKGKPEKRVFYLINKGTAPLDILAVQMSTTNAFTMSAPALPATIAPKKRSAVTVEFVPAETGGFAANVYILSDAGVGNTGATVTLTGKATKPAVSPTATPTSTPTIVATATPTATMTPTPSPTPAGQPTSSAQISSLTPGSAVVNSSAFTMDVRGVGFDPTAVVYWNSTSLPTTYVSNTELTAMVPASAISAIGTKFIGIASTGFSIGQPYTFLVGTTGGPGYAQLEIDQPTNDLVYDPLRQVIYLSVPAAAPTRGNTISVLDLTSGAISNSQFAGSSPDVLSISDDGQYLYAGLDGQASVGRFTLPTLTADISIPLPRNSNFGAYYPIDLQVAPGSPHTIAVSLANKGVSPAANGGVMIFDDATARATTAPGGGLDLFDSLQWGANASTLYASNTETSFDDFYTLSVNQGGVTLGNDDRGAFSNSYDRIHFDAGTGLVYADCGNVIDPATGNPAGDFPTTFGIMVPDSTIDSAFFVNSLPSPAVVQSYNLTQFSLINSISIPDLSLSDQALRVIRWGNNGIAFNTYDGGPVYVIGGNFVH